MRPSIKRRLLWILLWVERIRPTVCRSGFKGSVLSVALLLYVMTPSGGAFTQELPTLCTLFGIGCPEPVKQQREPSPRQWRQLLMSVGHGPGKPACTCHQDFHYGDDHYPDNVIHMFSEQVDCADVHEPKNVWIKISAGGSCTTPTGDGDFIVGGANCPEYTYNHLQPDGTQSSEILDYRIWSCEGDKWESDTLTIVK